MRTVIVVHPEPSISESLTHLLRSEGINVYKADGGMNALELCRSERPHAVIAALSTRWVQSDTVELVPKLRHEFPALTIVTLSGDGAMDAEARAKNIGSTYHFHTPVHFPEILSVVRSVPPGATEFDS